MKAIGLDLSLTGTGVCVLSEDDVVLETIRSKPCGDTPSDELRRLQGIISKIEGFLDEHEGVSIAAIEGLAYSARNTTALVQLAGLNYLTRDMLHRRGITFVIVQPSSLKKYITGKGNAQKDHIMLEIYKNFGITILDNNQSDAYALAHCAAAFSGEELHKLTAPQKDVVKLLMNQKKV